MKNSFFTPYKVYLFIISLIGVLIVGWSTFKIPTYLPFVLFAALLLLAIFAEITTTSVQLSQESGITFDVGTSVGMTAIALFSPTAGVFITAAANASLWLVKPSKRGTWKKSLSQLLFNNGMHAIAILGAGYFFIWFQSLWGELTVAKYILSFLLTAVCYDQLNLWLLLIILRLQHGKNFSTIAMWKDNLWAMPINIVVLTSGGMLLTYAAQQYNLIGIVIFFLPVLLTAYAFRLYVRQMRSHMDNLESIVAERTQELAARTQELESVNRDKDAFLAVLTHDMKTPLNSIGLYAELLEQRPAILEAKPHIPRSIRRNQQTLLNIVNNILDLEKLQAGRAMPLDKQTFDLQMLTEYLVESIHPQAQEKNITLSYNPRITAVMLEADQQQIERALVNLVSNAIKYTPEGGKVNIEMSEEAGTAVVKVCDNGYGIPQEELPYIFERYRRVGKHKHLASGTGLGLAVAKAIIEAHNGHVTATSEEGTGSTFILQLPLLQYTEPSPLYQEHSPT